MTDHDTVEELDTGVVAGETKAEAFRRLAKSRVTSVLDRIRLVGQLSNRSSYEYTEEQVDKIEQAMINAIAEMRMKFKPKSSTNKPTFDFEE